MRANMPPVLRATASPAFVASDAGFRCSGAAGRGTAASRLTQLPSLRVPAVGTAIGQVDGVIAKARMKLVGDLLHVLFKAAIARRDPFARFRHSTISVLSPGG